MTVGQVDPARLQGDALRRWYLRTPREIEAERAAAAADAYKVFFARPNGRPVSGFGNAAQGAVEPAADKLSPVGNTASILPVQKYHTGGYDPHSPTTEGRAVSDVQLAARSLGFWDYWSPRGCANCHGHTPDALPPVGGQSPLPPDYSPRVGSGSGQGGSRPERRDKMECEQQLESDTQICGRLPRRDDIAICRKTASERYAYCRKPDGAIGFPHLETRGGRRR